MLLSPAEGGMNEMNRGHSNACFTALHCSLSLSLSLSLRGAALAILIRLHCLWHQLVELTDAGRTGGVCR